MTYEFMQTRVLSRVTEAEESDLLAPYEYVVVNFKEAFTGYSPLTDDADLDRVLGRTIPLRFVDDQDIEIVYQVPVLEDNNSPSRAHVARTLLAMYDDLENCSSDCIPNQIAMKKSTRPEVAMYMFAYQLKTYEELAEMFGVEMKTIRRYRRRLSERRSSS